MLGREMAYVEVGQGDPIVLLHGNPTSSYLWRNVLPHLQPRGRCIAPDLIGMGDSDKLPDSGPGSYRFVEHRRYLDALLYTFDNIARVIERFTEVIGFDRFAVYVFDYGAPTGFRLAIRHPERITAMISQNGNAYEEGLSDGWNSDPGLLARAVASQPESTPRLPHAETTRWQYTHGVPDPTMVSPDGQNLDNFYLARPGADEIQLDLFGDYKSNVALYPEFQAHKPPFLAAWGKNDPFLLPSGAEAFKRDIPDADVRFFDTGHFALETHCDEIAAAIRNFLSRSK